MSLSTLSSSTVPAVWRWPTLDPELPLASFFITEDKYAAGNGHYAIFGQVVNGQPLVGKISHVLRDDHDRPKIPTTLIKITFMRVVPDATTDK